MLGWRKRKPGPPQRSGDLPLHPLQQRKMFTGATLGTKCFACFGSDSQDAVVLSVTFGYVELWDYSVLGKKEPLPMPTYASCC